MRNTIQADRIAIETCELYKDARNYATLYEKKKKDYALFLKETYFCKAEILVNDFGITLATAKLQERTSYDIEAIKADHPEIDFTKYEKVTISQPIDVK